MLILGVAFDSVVEGDGVHDVQQLTLVLVDTFHLIKKCFIFILQKQLKTVFNFTQTSITSSGYGGLVGRASASKEVSSINGGSNPAWGCLYSKNSD